MRIISALSPELALTLERDLLRREDLHLVTVTSIDELGTAARDGAQLCLVGPLLPDGDARDALETVRLSPSLSRVPVVLVATREERKELGEAGFSAVIELPYVGTTFDELLGPLLDARRRRGLRRASSARVLDSEGAPIGRAVDLSTGGLQVRTKRAHAAGDELRFALELPGSAPLAARGRVVRSREQHLALELIEPSPELSAALREAVEPLTLRAGLAFRPRPELGPRGASLGGALVEGAALAALVAHLGARADEPARLLVRELEPFDEPALDRWIALVGALSAEAPVEVHGCPSWLGDLAARMPAVLARGRARIVSLGVALRCPPCDDDHEDEVALGGLDPAGQLAAVEALSARPCAICAGRVRPAQPASATLAFVGGSTPR